MGLSVRPPLFKRFQEMAGAILGALKDEDGHGTVQQERPRDE